MEKLKLFKKMIIPAVLVFVVGVTGLLLKTPFEKWNFQAHERRLESHIEELTQNYNEILNGMAQTIKSIPVDKLVHSQIQADILYKNPSATLYLWMMDKDDRYIFGFPAGDFDRLNNAYAKYSKVIQQDGVFSSRNDFLLKLIDKVDAIDFSQFEAVELKSDVQYRWRFYKDSYRLGRKFGEWPDNQYQRSRCVLLSAPVSNEEGKGIGDLYLKIDDSKNAQLYYSDRYLATHRVYAELEPIFGVLTGFSGLFLWFLLPSWVYIDARKRGIKNILIWVVITLVSGLFGFAIYLITRPSLLKTFTCPSCDKELNGTRAFCPHCGFDLSSTFCPQCQYPLQLEWAFCPSCRAAIQGQKKSQKNRKKKEVESEPAPLSDE
jgi:hypothetical protein